MRNESSELKRSLRSGYTTGACATATSLAAATLLLELKQCTLSNIEIELPSGQMTTFDLHKCQKNQVDVASCATIKDAGDDPDVTHLAEIIATVKLLPHAGIVFKAGSGVGTVSKPGLAIGVGEPAINPVPRKMMQTHLHRLADRFDYSGGFEVSISISDGEALAKKTMNGRLGIVGGLSILGTTGIVKPFSCSAYIASIHQGMDVAKANGIEHIAACTGSSSERAIQTLYSMNDMARIEMGDYVGAVLKHTKKVQFAKISFIGGFGKLSKLANGHINLHSQKSNIDFKQFAEIAAELGASTELQTKIRAANTSAEVLSLCTEQGIGIATQICTLALQQIQSRMASVPQLECIAIDKSGNIVANVSTE